MMKEWARKWKNKWNEKLLMRLNPRCLERRGAANPDLKRDTIPELGVGGGGGGRNRKSPFTHLGTHSGNNQLIIMWGAEIKGSV